MKVEEMTSIIREIIPDIAHRPISQLCVQKLILKILNRMRCLMAISYPLSLPSVAGIKNVNFRAVNTVGISASPFTYAQQVYKYEGQKWEAEVTLPSMQRENAEEWISF